MIKDISEKLREIPSIDKAAQKAESNPLSSALIHNNLFRARFSLYCGLMLNILYAVLKFLTGWYYNSNLNSAMAGYYFALSFIRFTLARAAVNGVRKKTDYISELMRYRRTGILMLWLSSTISGLMTVVLMQENAHRYPVWIICLNAVYTMITMTLSIINIKKYHDLKYPVVCAAKNVGLAAALMSLFNLQAAVLSYAFADDSVMQTILNSMTGLAIRLIILVMAVIMVIRGTKMLKKHR